MCLRDLDVPVGREQWKYFYTAVGIIHIITIVLGCLYVGLGYLILSLDSRLTLAPKIDAWRSFYIQELVSLSILGGMTAFSIILVLLCAFIRHKLFQYSINLYFHAFGSIGLLILLGIKVDATIQMEDIQTTVYENYLDTLNKTHPNMHFDSQHTQRYVIKGAVAVLITANMMLFLDIVLRLKWKMKKRHDHPFLDDEFKVDDGHSQYMYFECENQVVPLDDDVDEGEGQIIQALKLNSNARPVYQPAKQPKNRE